MAERSYGEAPRLAEGVRGQIADALYQQFYRDIPREQYDRDVAARSDLDLANAAHRAFYSDISRPEFNQRVGLTSASGSTQRALTGGMTFGLQDEVGAAAAGLVGLASGEGFGPAYSRSRDAQRQNAEVFRQNNPYVGRAAEFAGGALTGQAALQAPTAARVAANSAAQGALGGFGDAEGGTENRLLGAGIGAGIGGAIGAVVPYATRLLGSAATAIGRAMGRGDSDEAATQMLLRAMEQDGVDPRMAMARLTQWRQSGAAPEALFDLGGENTRALARTAASRVGPGRQRAVDFLAERQSGQAARAADDVSANLGADAGDFAPRLAQLTETRRTAAAPFYDRAFRIQLQPEEYARVGRFVEDPIGQDALQRGLRVIEVEHLARNQPFNPADYGVQRGANGWEPAQGVAPNMRLMDAVKRGYDEIVEGFRDGTSGRLNLTQYGSAVNEARAAYRNELAEMFPPYRRALEAWSGPSSSMDAMARGRNLFNLRDEEAARLAVEVRRTPGEAEFFRLGAAQAIRDRIFNTRDGADAVKNIFGSESRRRLLRAAFPDQASYDAFAAQMRRELAMFTNAQSVSPNTGSQTAPRQSDEQAFNAAADLVQGRPVSAAMGFMRDRMAGARGVTPEVADMLTQRLFTADEGAVNNALAELARVRGRNALSTLSRRRLASELYPRLTTGVVAAEE